VCHQVRLSTGYHRWDDAEDGPMARGEIGKIHVNDGSEKPYLVKVGTWQFCLFLVQ
jgi:hypothetical protein